MSLAEVDIVMSGVMARVAPVLIIFDLVLSSVQTPLDIISVNRQPGMCFHLAEMPSISKNP